MNTATILRPRITHPATMFLRRLEGWVVTYSDLPVEHRAAVYLYLSDGVWGDLCRVPSDSLRIFRDVKFIYGSIPNDADLKEAFVSSYAGFDGDENPDIDAAYSSVFLNASMDGALPVVLNSPDVAPESGLFGWGYSEFTRYWRFRSKVEYVALMPDWDFLDPSGRGGQ